MGVNELHSLEIQENKEEEKLGTAYKRPTHGSGGYTQVCSLSKGEPYTLGF
jgi:hypothetical protein